MLVFSYHRLSLQRELEKCNRKVLADFETNSVPMGYFKSDAVFSSSEYGALDQRTQEQLKKPTVPIFEIATVNTTLQVVSSHC